MTSRHRPWLAIAVLSCAAVLSAQEADPTTPTAPAAPAAPAPRPREGRIINLPTTDVPAAGTLSVLFTHRFSQAVEDSDIHSLYSFDSGAEIGIGLAWAPVKNLEISAYRSSRYDDYEVDAKWQLLRGGFGLALRAGGDWKTEVGLRDRSSFFAQTVIGVSIGSRVRITAVPTYVSRYGGERFISPKPLYENIYNVPGAISIAVTRSVSVHGEVYPRIGRGDSTGVGWMASIEKSVPRHRFSFTVGNLRGTTVSQYVASVFSGLPPKNYFLGFNLSRQWNL